MTEYPPERHLLRDLRLSFDNDADTPRAWMPIVPHICGDDGSVRAGALAVLVDVVGGGLAARAAQPDWIATADLTLHSTRAATTGDVVACARVLRAGRTTVVIEVDLQNRDRQVGLATMSFSVLPRRDVNLDLDAVRPQGPSTMALPESALDAPLFELVGITMVDAPAGVVELPVREWAMNSMGALQGGIVAAAVEAAAEAALRVASGTTVVVADLQLSYLSFGKVGPLRTRTAVLVADPDHAVARVELFDTGAEARQMTFARVAATRPLT
jgi:uncharacterized protein (TIGR00369 family)